MTTLSNGLRVATHDIKDRSSISIGIWIAVGGRYETDRLKGAAHFIEHILFKGSARHSCDEIKERVEGVGGTLNAFTSEEMTCFYAKIPSVHLEQTFDVLSDMVHRPKIAARDVKKESAVIIEEIKMYHDLPQYYVMEVLDGLLWPGHPLGKSLAGTMESVAGLGAKELRAFHKDYYAAKNIVVVACGDLKHQKIVDLAKAALGQIDSQGGCQFEVATHQQSHAQSKYVKRNIEQMHFALGMPGYDENHKDRYALALLNVILGGNMSSRLFVQLREKRGLAYSISSGMKPLRDTGAFLIRAGVDNSKIVDATDVILKELKKIRRREVSADEFSRARDYLLGQLLLGLEDTMEHMLWLGEALLSRNKLQTLEGVVKEFQRVTPGDLLRVARDVIDERRFNLAVVGPIKEEQEKALDVLLKIS